MSPVSLLLGVGVAWAWFLAWTVHDPTLRLAAGSVASAVMVGTAYAGIRRRRLSAHALFRVPLFALSLGLFVWPALAPGLATIWSTPVMLAVTAVVAVLTVLAWRRIMTAPHRGEDAGPGTGTSAG